MASRATLWTQGQATDWGSIDGLTIPKAHAEGLSGAGSAIGFSRRETTGSVSQATLWRTSAAALNQGSLQPDSS